MKLINVRRYIPDELFLGDGIQYFIDETGKDWFNSLSLFTKKYALVVEPDSGIVRGITEDVSRLYPAGFNVVEVDTLPEGCDCMGGWIFDGEKIISRVYTPDERQAQARQKQTRLLQEAAREMAPLQDASDLDMTTDAEKASLLAWKKYRVLLNRVDISASLDGDIDWPQQPDKNA
ncbi:tail fiber assembly protein [Arsenophonus nasoniae]|uniref:Tail fiber assembly protein n=1 Tax=Arsenophonus nasoniae TaxID=638 RepID=A0AA95GL65_9GAMM|nr:tail fiber assembly protein [Arsenophonus nasoniae]WGM01017.1 tail fiber assembly protein [Arsenophonus nasoniae]